MTDALSPADFTRTLSQARGGDPQAAAVLFPLVYAQLKRLAAGYLRGQAAGHTLQPTALVHESYLRLCDRDTPYADRAHFTAVAATAMRQILIDHARRAGTRRAADAMYIRFIIAGEVIIDHMADVFHINTAGSDIGCNENAVFATLETRESFFALVKRTIGVDFSGGVTHALNLKSDLVSTMFGA